MKRIAVLILLAVLCLTVCACSAPTQVDAEARYPEIYATDTEKQAWRDAIVKLISNQQSDFGGPESAPCPGEPSIAAGYDMGLFDINVDGVPELLLNLGGGSAGNDYFYVYDIFSGKMIGQLEGGGDGAWSMYYDIQNDCYLPVSRYDWRIGAAGSEHYVTTVIYDSEHEAYREKGLFYATYEYIQKFVTDENGNFDGVELEIVQAEYTMNGEAADFQEYHYAMTRFYREYSFVPGTGIKLYAWSEVSDAEDTVQERAEKMAEMLLFGSGQRFVRPAN